MKITWITQRHPPDIGGMAQSSGRLVNGLGDTGAFVQVIHLASKSNEGTVGPGHILDNWNRISIPGLNIPVSPERIFATFKDKLSNSVIVGFGGDYPAYLATLWARWLKVPSVALFRGNDFEKTVHDSKRAWLTHFVLGNADGVGAVTKEMTARIATMRTGPTQFTPNSVDTSQWRYLKDDLTRAEIWKNKEELSYEKPIIGLYGQLKSKKGLDLVLNLFEDGLKERAYLLTVGDIPEEMQLPESDYWRRVSFQKGGSLPSFYAVADIVFVPSYYDGMPNVLLEAMALEKVVVASRAGAICDVVQDGLNGFLFDIGDLNSAKNALKQAMEITKEQRRQIGICARKHMENEFNKQKETDRLQALIEKARNQFNGL